MRGFLRTATVLAALTSFVGCGSSGFSASVNDGGAEASQDPDSALFGDSSPGPVCSHWVQRRYLPGPDGLLGTSDDALEAKALTQEVDGTDSVSTETVAAAAGADGKWGTADDVIESQQRVIKTGPTAIDIVRASGPGVDGQWGTDDDVVASYRSGTLANGRVVEAFTFSGAGPDGKWRTADDVAAQRWVYAYGDALSAPRIREDNFNGWGADATWRTADDQLAIVTSRWSDWGIFSTAAGVDGKWGTKDDVATSRYTDLRNQGGWSQFLQSWGAGPDKALFTSDDTVGSTATSKCADGVFDARIHQSAGSDGTWGTSDDVLSARMRIEGCPTSCDGDLPKAPLDPR